MCAIQHMSMFMHGSACLHQRYDLVTYCYWNISVSWERS